MPDSFTSNVTEWSIESNILNPKNWVYQLGNVSTFGFYPFGTSDGDTRLLNVDNYLSDAIRLTVPFNFFNRYYTSLYISTNGYISFIDNYNENIPEQFPIQNIPMIAAFWDDIDTSKGGNIYYKQITSTSTLTLISNDINQSSFRASWAFIATWDRVAAFYSEFIGLRNSFQLILATDGKLFFIIFKYGEISWSKYTQGGYNSGFSTNFHILPGSLTSSVIFWPIQSNVHIPGNWVFHIGNIQNDVITTTQTNTIVDDYRYLRLLLCYFYTVFMPSTSFKSNCSYLIMTLNIQKKSLIQV